MHIFIELPSWLGDSVMATPAIENMIKVYPNAKITLFGTYVSTALFEKHPQVQVCIVDKSKASTLRGVWLFRMVQRLPDFELAVSFRSSWYSKLLLLFLTARKKAHYQKAKHLERHQVLRYNDFVNTLLASNMPAEDLKTYFHPAQNKKPTLGINPGASYGSAKRWYPEKFAKVAIALSTQYDILIFGGPSEIDIASDIEKELVNAKIDNYVNIAGKTNIKEMCEKIGGLDLFITGDSGPMHVASAFKVPTVAIFGPTKDNETSQWHNPQSIVVKKEMACAPCMKRTCPLKHHECMTSIMPDDVLDAVEALKNKRYDNEKTV